jgi:hypothetical protein
MLCRGIIADNIESHTENVNKLRSKKYRDYSISANVIHGYTNDYVANSQIFVSNVL